MKRKFTKRMKAAIRQYYDSRTDKGFAKPKQECLDDIFAARKGNRIRAISAISAISAMAGTFWMSWPDGVLTIHKEQNWWRMKILRPINSSIIR